MLLQKRKTKKRVLQKSVMLLQLTPKTKKEALQNCHAITTHYGKRSTAKCCDASPRSTTKCCNSITP